MPLSRLHLRFGVLALLASCGRISFESLDAATIDAAPPDTTAPDASPDAIAPRTWSAETTNVGDKLWAVTGFTASEIYAGSSSAIVLSTGPGTWTTAHTPGVNTYGIHAIGAEVFAVGNVDVNGALLVRGRGTSWTREVTGIARPLNGVWGWPGDIYVVGHDGNILHSTGNGTWTLQTSPTTSVLQAVWGSSPTNLYAVGYDGTILHSTGDGTWLAEDSTTTVNLISVWGATDGTVFVAGHDGTVLRGGSGTWTPEPTDILSNLANGWAAGSDDYLAVGASGEIFHSAGDATWSIETSQFAGTALDGIWSDIDAGVTVVVGNAGLVGRATR